MERKKRDRRKKKKEQSFCDTYWFEMTVVTLMGMGIFLILEELEIKAAVYHFVVDHFVGAWTYIRSTGRSVLDWIRQVKTSNMVGFTLIVIAVVMMLWKLRLRAFKRHPHITLCPVCGADLHRIHCTFRQRIQELFLWLRITHYSCCKCPFRTTVWSEKDKR